MKITWCNEGVLKSSGADLGEVKWVNFHPLFLCPLNLSFSFISLEYWNNIWFLWHYYKNSPPSPPFQNPGSALEVACKKANNGWTSGCNHLSDQVSKIQFKFPVWISAGYICNLLGVTTSYTGPRPLSELKVWQVSLFLTSCTCKQPFGRSR